MMPKPTSPYAKIKFCNGGFEVYCVTDDWDFGDYNATWHFHMVNIYPTGLWTEDKT